MRLQADFFNALNHPNNAASVYGSANPIGQDGILSTRTSGWQRANFSSACG
jgi:hypothetical protein